jgi:hypothetical protein
MNFGNPFFYSLRKSIEVKKFTEFIKNNSCETYTLLHVAIQ